MREYALPIVCGIVLGILGVKIFTPKPCLPKVGLCYEDKEEPRESGLYQIQKVTKTNEEYTTTVYTFPNDERFLKGKWARSQGGLLDETRTSWFMEHNRQVDCPW